MCSLASIRTKTCAVRTRPPAVSVRGIVACSRSWIRTMLRGSKGRCPAARRTEIERCSGARRTRRFAVRCPAARPRPPFRPGRLLSLSRWVVSRARGAPLRVVRPSRIELASAGYRPAARPLSYGRMVWVTGVEPAFFRFRTGRLTNKPSPRCVVPRLGVEPSPPALQASARHHESLRGASPGMAPGLHRRLFRCQRTEGATLVRGSTRNRTEFLRLRAGSFAIKALDPFAVPPGGLEPPQAGLKVRCPGQSGAGGAHGRWGEARTHRCRNDVAFTARLATRAVPTDDRRAFIRTVVGHRTPFP